MKVGDTFYFVDESLGKITKHKLFENDYVGDVELPHFYFSGGKFKITLIHFKYNPAPENYNVSKTYFWGSTKSYLVFTEVEDAQRALVEYVLPKLLEIQKKAADKLGKEFQKLLEKSEKIEEELKKNTKDFDKKCNALKSKFV